MDADPEVGSAADQHNTNGWDPNNCQHLTEESLQYTLDGTVDLSGKSALRQETGAWSSASYVVSKWAHYFKTISRGFLLASQGSNRDIVSDSLLEHTRPCGEEVVGPFGVVVGLALGLVAFSQALSTMAFWGVGNNLVVYLIEVMHLGNAAAANIVSNWVGTAEITPLIAAILADSYWGRFWTSIIFSAIFLQGVVLVTISGMVPVLRPSQCKRNSSTASTCQQASTGQMAMLYAALYVIALGGGGLQSTLTTFGADQFDVGDEREKQQKSSFFNWYYGATNAGFMVSLTVLLYFQEKVGYGVGYAMSVAAALLALVTLLVGLPIYRYSDLKANPFTRIAQVVVASARNWQPQPPPANQLTPELSVDKHRSAANVQKTSYTLRFRFLDKAVGAIETKGISTEETNPWRRCTASQVEEVKCLLRLLPIFLTTVFFSTVYTQHSTLFIEQAMMVDRRLRFINLPPASVRVFEPISVILWVAVYDALLVPMLRPYTGHPRGLSELQRIGIGLLLSVVTMVIAASVEHKRLRIASDNNLLDSFTIPVPMSVLWLVPQYVVVGASQTFVFVGIAEFFYAQVPDQLRSVGSALASMSGSMGSYLSTALVMIVNWLSTRKKADNDGWISDNLNRAHLDKFFWLLASLSAFNLFFFILCAHWYTNAKHYVKFACAQQCVEDSPRRETSFPLGADRIEPEEHNLTTEIRY